MKPTNRPLSVREFGEARCGVCFGCGCACGYIAYLKDGKLVDVYGHPHHPSNIGSLCSRGITLLQRMVSSPFRLTRPLLRKGSSWTELEEHEAQRWMERNLSGRVGVFLSRHTSLEDYLAVKKLTENVYGDALHLPFSASTVRPRRWSSKRVILSLECEPVFSEVMSARWLVDACERSAYIVSVSSRYATVSAKASKRVLVKPPLVVRFIEELANAIEGKEVGHFREEVERLAVAFSSLTAESLILVGDTLLRSRWRANVLSALRRIRNRLKVDYSVVGDVSPFELGELPEFLSDLESFDSLILFGNPALYMSDEQLRALEGKRVVHFSPFPNLTSHHAQLVVPSALFQEREFTGYRTCFGALYRSTPVLTPPPGAVDPARLIASLSGREPDTEGFLLSRGVKPDRLMEEEGSELPARPIELWEGQLEPAALDDEGIFLICDNGLVDETGRWSLWTHELEGEQEALLNSGTAEKLGADGYVRLGAERLRTRISSNIADETVWLPLSFEETQPFLGGVRPGRILKEGGHRIEKL